MLLNRRRRSSVGSAAPAAAPVITAAIGPAAVKTAAIMTAPIITAAAEARADHDRRRITIAISVAVGRAVIAAISVRRRRIIIDRCRRGGVIGIVDVRPGWRRRVVIG